MNRGTKGTRLRYLWALMLLASLVYSPVAHSQTGNSAADRSNANAVSGEPYRPQYHLTAQQNWLGIPNGLVTLDGEYHLFYQHNPAGKTPGVGFWGHAASTDLVNWQHQPIALYPDRFGSVEPGGVVVDADNTAGFGAGAMVALFSQKLVDDRVLNLAYSTDGGQTWLKYDGNPVIDLPNWFAVAPAPRVFWYGAADGAVDGSGTWVMVLSTGDDLWFYTSPDLKAWSKVGDFGKGYGSHDGAWGAADLFALPVDGGPQTAWVLTVSTENGSPARGPGVQYFVGDFDGTTFTSRDPAETERWLDAGADFYGSMTWRDAGHAAEDERRLLIGWMSNPTYAGRTPTASWRGAMALPRELALVTMEGGPQVVQQPLSELQSLRQPLVSLSDEVIAPGTNLLDGVTGDALEIEAEFDVSSTTADRFGFRVRIGDGEYAAIGYAPALPAEEDLTVYTIDNPGFETGDLTGWTATGSAFTDGDVSDATDWGWGCCFEAVGSYHLWGWQDGGDDQTGELRSKTFILGGTGEIDFLIGGGNNPEALYVALVRASDDAELLRTTNIFWADHEKLTRIYWDATEYLGEELYIKVEDNATGGWGHINVDDFNVYHPRNVIFVDRTHSGQVGFDPAFAARHSAQMTPHEGKIGLHIFVDRSSVEVFGNDGRLVMTERIFPDPASLGLELFADGGEVALASLDVYQLTPSTFVPVPPPDVADAPLTLENADFETGDLSGWTTMGNAFGEANVTGQPHGQQGTYQVLGLTDEGSGLLTGVMRSGVFTLDPEGQGWVEFLVSGGKSLDSLYVALVRASDGQELFRATGKGDDAYRRVTWDAARYRGDPLYFEVVDYDVEPSGAINVDDFRTLDVEGVPAFPGTWSFDEGAGKLAGDTVSGIQDPINYVFNDAQYKADSDPLWRDGISGTALLFDGYSTWIERPADNFFQAVDQLTIAAWIAPRSHEWGDLGQMSAIVNQHDEGKGAGYILGMGRHGAWSFQAGLSGAWYEVWADQAHSLPRDQWSYVVATLDTTAGTMQLYLNGELMGETAVPSGSRLTTTTENLLIGQHNQAAVINATFRANMFNGLIDELQVSDRAVSEEEIQAAYEAYLEPFGGAVPRPDTEQKRSRYDGDRYRPQYHFIPPEHWMNEPHAPLYFDGQYHIFYQHNPQGPYWHQIHWGHAVSDDMVHWVDQPWALSPEAGSVAPDGVWSGDADLDANGDPVLFFTAGDDSKVPNQNVGLALPAEPVNPLPNWEMDEGLVIVQEPEQLVEVEAQGRTVMGNVWYGQFRDPFVWQELDDQGTPTWYLIIGSGVKLGEASGLKLEEGSIPFGGAALIYTSANLFDWTFHGALYVGNVGDYPWTGVVWELPVLLPLGQDSQGKEKHVLMVNPWFEGYSPYAVKNVYYWIGTWDRENYRFIPDDQEPRRWDYGDHFTGPSGMVDDQGRSIVFSIAQDRRTEQQHYDSAWAHNAGLPIVVSLLADDSLGIQPIPELSSLRVEPLASFTSKSLEAANQLLAGVGGDLLEVVVELEPGDATQFGVKVRRSGDGQEETLFYYDMAEGSLNVDRTRSSLDPDSRKGIQGDRMALDGSTLRLHIFVDRSMAEVYANNRASITTRVYPTLPDAVGVQVWADGGVTVKAMDVWRLESAYGETVPAYYPEPAPVTPHGQLPNHSFQSCDLTGWIAEGKAFSDHHITSAEDWGWGGPFFQADDGSNGCHLWGVHPAHQGDDATGALRSQTFTLGGDGQIDFLLGGGNRPEELYVALVRAADGEILLKATGHDSEQYRRVRWDAADYIGEKLYIEAVDQAQGGWGHLNLDDVNVPTEEQFEEVPVATPTAVAETRVAEQEAVATALPSATAAPAAEPSPTSIPAAEQEGTGPAPWLPILVGGGVVVIVAVAVGLWLRGKAG
jgi:sucrose-6-phosphate hydrolase SacC (GH32 family)